MVTYPDGPRVLALRRPPTGTTGGNARCDKEHDMKDHSSTSASNDQFRLLPSYGLYLRMSHGGALGFDIGEADTFELMKSAFTAMRPNKRQKRQFARLCRSMAKTSSR